MQPDQHTPARIDREAERQLAQELEGCKPYVRRSSIPNIAAKLERIDAALSRAREAMPEEGGT